MVKRCWQSSLKRIGLEVHYRCLDAPCESTQGDIHKQGARAERLWNTTKLSTPLPSFQCKVSFGTHQSCTANWSQALDTDNILMIQVAVDIILTDVMIRVRSSSPQPACFSRPPPPHTPLELHFRPVSPSSPLICSSFLQNIERDPRHVVKLKEGSQVVRSVST